MCSCVIVDGCHANLALNCRFQVEQLKVDSYDSDDGPFALDLRSLYFLSASQIRLLHTELLFIRKVNISNCK